MAALVEALVGEELELGGIFGAHALRDLALEEGGVGAQRLQHRLLVLAEQRLHEHRRVAKVGRHAHFGDADQVAGQRIVMDVAALEQFAQHVAHLLADAEQADASGPRRFRLGAHRLQRPGAFLDLEHFEVVARLDVVGVGQQHAAFEARA